jgi:hypothetical protein
MTVVGATKVTKGFTQGLLALLVPRFAGLLNLPCETGCYGGTGLDRQGAAVGAPVAASSNAVS